MAHAAGTVEVEDVRDRDILDIGCGFGWFEVAALDNGVRSIVGIEISDDDLATARRHIGDARARFLVGSAIDLPFPAESFDTVVCWEVLEHIPRGTEAQAFSEVARVLRPGGVFYMSTPYASGLARVLDPAWWLVGHRHYHKRDLAALARDAGLTVDMLDVRGGAWQIAAILNVYAAKWIFRRGPFLEAFVNARVDREMSRSGGYVDCFMKCRASVSNG
jgi:ubiquinone/menaquinone biosynthesis C-methylase UbiE